MKHRMCFYPFLNSHVLFPVLFSHTRCSLSLFSLTLPLTATPRTEVSAYCLQICCVCVCYIKRKQTEEQFFALRLGNVKSIVIAAKKTESFFKKKQTNKQTLMEAFGFTWLNVHERTCAVLAENFWQK